MTSDTTLPLLALLAVLTVIGLVAAFVLQPIAVGRLEQARAQGRGGSPEG